METTRTRDPSSTHNHNSKLTTFPTVRRLRQSVGLLAAVTRADDGQLSRSITETTSALVEATRLFSSGAIRRPTGVGLFRNGSRRGEIRFRATLHGHRDAFDLLSRRDVDDRHVPRFGAQETMSAFAVGVILSELGNCGTVLVAVDLERLRATTETVSAERLTTQTCRSSGVMAIPRAFPRRDVLRPSPR